MALPDFDPTDPYPYSFFTPAQIASLGGIYTEARRRLYGKIAQGLRAATKAAYTWRDSTTPAKAVILADSVCNLLYSYWPFLPVSMQTVALATMPADSIPAGGIGWVRGENLAPPCGIWRYGLDMAFFGGMPQPDNTPFEYPPSGELFLGLDAPYRWALVYYRALQFGRWGNPAYTPPNGGRFGSITKNAQNNTYKLYFPYPLFYCLPGAWPFSVNDETNEQRGTREALESYSARVLSGEIEIV